MVYEIAVKEIAPQPMVAIRVTVPRDQLGDLMDEVVPEVWHYLDAQGIPPAGPPFARYHRYDPDEVDIEIGLPVATSIAGQGRIQPGALPGGQVAATWHQGQYETLPAAYEALDAWLAQQEWTEAGAPWEVYWTDPRAVADPNEWRTEVLWPVR